MYISYLNARRGGNKQRLNKIRSNILLIQSISTEQLHYKKFINKYFDCLVWSNYIMSINLTIPNNMHHQFSSALNELLQFLVVVLVDKIELCINIGSNKFADSQFLINFCFTLWLTWILNKTRLFQYTFSKRCALNLTLPR